jgi:5-methylcytosine-specific restriction endonuclease McrA
MTKKKRPGIKMAKLGAGVRELNTATAKPLTDDRQRRRELHTGSAAHRALRDQVRLRDEYACQHCGILEPMSDWPLELDHINGDAMDNRLENLRMLCKPCHSKHGLDHTDAPDDSKPPAKPKNGLSFW